MDSVSVVGGGQYRSLRVHAGCYNPGPLRSRIATLLLLVTASCGGDPPPEHEAMPRVRARIEALLPHLRAELGEDAIRDIPVTVLDGKDLGPRVADECSYPERVFGPLTREQRAGGFLLAALFSSVLVTDDGGVLLVYNSTEGVWFDACLIHGLVKAELVKGRDLAGFRSGPGSYEDALVRNAALEALTRISGRRIAARAGVRDTYTWFDRGPIRHPAPEEVTTGLFHSVYVGAVGDAYLRRAA